MSKEFDRKLPKTFWWANYTQFGGALNDNLFKWFMLYALIDWLGEDQTASILSIGNTVFAIPFILFLPLAGTFSDHFSKRSVIVLLKAVEVGVMCFGVLAMTLKSDLMVYATMFLMSTQSAFYGPSKYGIIPEQVGPHRLSRANGMIQMFTNLAILAGTIAAPALSETLPGDYGLITSVCIVIALTGLLFSLRIEPTPAHRHRPVNLNGFTNIYRTAKLIKKDGFLTLAVLASSFFNFMGAFILVNIVLFGTQHLGLENEQSTRLFLLTAVGIGIGSVSAGRLSGRVIEFGIVPIGTAIMFACLLVMGLVPEGAINTVMICMFLVGIGAGLYIVPLESFIQYRSPKDRVASVKATNGFLSWIGILLAGGFFSLNTQILGLTGQQGFLSVSVLLFGLTAFSLFVLPDFFIKFVVMCVTRFFYRLRVFGIENLPTDRAALLVCNHVSLIDALLVVSCQQRRIRVLMSRAVFNESGWFVRRLVRLSGVILVQDSDGPKKLILSLKEARKALDDGFLVCIFAEGALSLSGMMRPFKPGFERIITGSDHAVIPVFIGGAWGSYASWKHGMPTLNPLRDFRYPVSVHFGEELPSTATVQEVQQAVCQVSTQTFELMKQERRSMAEEFILVARKNFNKVAVVGSNASGLTYGELLMAGSRAGKRLVDQLDPEEQRMGILARDAIDNVILNIALSLNNLTAVPLGADEADSSLINKITNAGVQALISDDRSRLKNLSVKRLSTGDLLHESDPSATISEKIRAKWFPLAWICRMDGFSPDDTATIQFTRGTTAEPKAVKLSHHNILSNIEALREVVRPEDSDTILGALPLSTIYGYTISIWLPLLSAARVVYTAVPFDLGSTRELSGKYRVSILPATPGFIQNCIEQVPADSFRSLRLAFTGGAPLGMETAQRFADKFKTRPLEAYVATELSPVCSLSLPDLEIGPYREKGTSTSRAGRLLQGIAVKIVDPDTWTQRPAGETGLIVVKGPNVMTGYYNNDNLTRRIIRDGWFSTGDMGLIDEDGFLAVAGRMG